MATRDQALAALHRPSLTLTCSPSLFVVPWPTARATAATGADPSSHRQHTTATPRVRRNYVHPPISCDTHVEAQPYSHSSCSVFVVANRCLRVSRLAAAPPGCPGVGAAAGERWGACEGGPRCPPTMGCERPSRHPLIPNASWDCFFVTQVGSTQGQRAGPGGRLLIARGAMLSRLRKAAASPNRRAPARRPAL
jgi:hypothetical protein